MAMHDVARSNRSSRRPLYYVPLALFSVSIIGGLVVLAAEIPTLAI